MKPSRRRLLAALLCALPFAILGDEQAQAFLLRRGGVSSSAPVTSITSFHIINTSASTSKCRYRRAIWFAKGDMPSGYVPVITQGVTNITAQFDERTTWSDGSLKVSVMSMMDADFSGLEDRTYSIGKQLGTFNNTGVRTLADVTGAHTFQVGFSSTTQFNGSTTVTRGSGAFTADFNSLSAVATRVYNYHSGPVCSSWEVWGMATDNTGGAADPHLQTIWYVTAWNNPNGTLNDVEYGAVCAQQWWSVASKFRLNYTATLQDNSLGSPTINTYSTIQHPYRSQWMTVRQNNDLQHAKRFWAGAIPTLYHTFDKNYARSTGLFGYLSATLVPQSNATAGYTSSYVPCSAQNQRANIDGTGDYQARGLMPATDCNAWMLQTALDYRYARTNAFGGLHIPYHYRSDASRTISSGPQAGTDTANTAISLKMRPLSAPTYDFRSQGMPAAMDAYVGGQQSPLDTTVYVSPLGGTGVWSISNDATHAGPYSYGMYLYEGERHFMQATIDLATNCAHQVIGNTFGGAPTATYSGVAPFQTLLSIPSTQYSGIAGQRPASNGNNRNVGWAMLLVAQAAVVCPDNDVQSGYIKLFQSQQAAYCVFNSTYMVSSQLTQGIYDSLQNSGVRFMNAPWMSNFQVIGHAFNAKVCEDANSVTFINNCLQYTAIAPWESGTQQYRSKDYRELAALKGGVNWDATTNPFLARSDILLQIDLNVFPGTNVLDLSSSSSQPTDGDPLYFHTTNSTFTVAVIPPGFTEAQKYFAVNSNPSARTCQVSATKGGSPISISDNSFALTGASQSGFVATYNFTGTAPVWLAVGQACGISNFSNSNYNAKSLITGVGANSFTMTLTVSGLGAVTAPANADFGFLSASQSGTTATYNFVSGTAPAWLQVGAAITTTGFTPGGYNSTFTVVSVGASSCTAVLASSGLANSTAPGQAVISWSIGTQPQNWSLTPAQNPPYLPTADDYCSISNTALIMAYYAGANAVTPTMLTRAANFVSTIDQTTYSPWGMAA